MEKAFDLKDLVGKLKDGGLDVAEEGAKHVVESVLNWVGESVVLTPNKVDDFALVVIPAVKPYVMAQLDKIDGEVG
jgi:hypothetical protein